MQNYKANMKNDSRCSARRRHAFIFIFFSQRLTRHPEGVLRTGGHFNLSYDSDHIKEHRQEEKPEQQ
jgi:hypothetical protein